MPGRHLVADGWLHQSGLAGQEAAGLQGAVSLMPDDLLSVGLFAVGVVELRRLGMRTPEESPSSPVARSASAQAPAGG